MKKSLLFILVFLSLLSAAQPMQLGTLGGGFSNQVYNAVTELYYDTTTKKLYAGGLFALAEGKSVWGAAVWDGNQWDSLQGGFSQFPGQVSTATSQAVEIWKIIEYKGKIYFAGNFDWVNGKSQHCLAVWDGTSWEYPLSYSLSAGNSIKDMKVHNGVLYACGNFTSIGNVACNYVAKYDGINWLPIGDMTQYFGMAPPHSMNAIEIFNNEIYVGGLWSNSEKQHIAKFNGANWVNVGAGIGQGGSSGVFALKTYNERLYIGGYFSQSDNVPGEGLIVWNGLSYERAAVHNLSGYGIVTKFCVNKNRLIARGNFQNYGPHEANGILFLDANQQCSAKGLANTFTTSAFWSIQSIASMNDTLVLGGQFNSIGSGTPAKNIANVTDFLNGANCTLVGFGENSFSNADLIIYPNPAKADFVVETFSDERRTLYIRDIQGRGIKQLSINQKESVSAADFGPGVYILQLYQDRRLLATKKIVLIK